MGGHPGTYNLDHFQAGVMSCTAAIFLVDLVSLSLAIPPVSSRSPWYVEYDAQCEAKMFQAHSTADSTVPELTIFGE